MTSHLKVASYSELQDCINALPPPAPGLVRVYRGQDQPWPLLPSGRRRTVPRADIWGHYLRRLVIFVERTGVYDDLDREFQIWLVWLQALAQHYGAGSNYLDVTHDLGVATWFAFHKLKIANLETVVGPPNTTGQDSIVKTSWIRLLPQTGPAYLYVLDVKPWSGKGLVEPGEVVDLAQAPELFHSERIRVQSGCLVYADEKQDLGKQYLVPGTPIEVAGGFEQSPYASWTVENIFPPPVMDSWYAHFLSLPFLLTPDAAGNDPYFTQSLPIQLFLSSPESSYVADIRSRFHHLLPALVYPLGPSQTQPTAGQWWTNLDPEAATVIVLEGPQISAHPPVDNPMWNHDLLMSDWTTDVETFDLATNAPAGRVTIENVVIEFSPLEEVDWYEGEAGGDLLRAMWIVRGPDSAMAVYPLYQDYPGFNLAQAGPILIRLNPERRRLEWRAPGGKGKWADLTDLKVVAKAIVSSFVLLRDLSPLPKMAAYPMLHTGTADDQWNSLMPVSSGVARLYRTTGSNAARPWYMLRDVDGQPYTTAKANTGSIKITTATPFGEIPAAQLRQFLAAELEKDHDPVGNGTEPDSPGTGGG